jgi:hypothetical protein
MDEYADIYFIDDNRNAFVTSDHRTGGGGGTGRTGPVRIASAQPARTVVIGPGSSNQGRPVYVGAQPPFIYNQPYQQPYPQSTAARMLGQLTTGKIIEMVTQAFAALQSLPAAPAVTKDATTDVGNMILFQNALALHAKRDEQVRTIGALIARMVE